MASSFDFSAPRLFVPVELTEGITFEPEHNQAHYLLKVMRLKPGHSILVFNGHQGEWRADVIEASRRSCILKLIEQTRPQSPLGDIQYLFAPVKRARLDFLVQKATELGASVLQPVLTRRTIVERIKLERVKANAIEAAEQCGILTVPEIREPRKLEELLSHWSLDRRIIFCDENAPISDPIAALSQLDRGPLAVLIGPEGGFDETERRQLSDQKFVTSISLGPRIMRADTAGIAALTLVQAVLGDMSKTNI